MSRIGSFVAKEIREAVPPALFFLLLFHMIALTKAVASNDYSVTALRTTAATIGALIVAKAILVVDALPVSKLFARRLAVLIVWKTLLFWLVTLVFRIIEESIELAPRHGAWLAGFETMYDEIDWPAFGVIAVWLLGALFLYNVVVELVHALGRDNARHLFFGVRDVAPRRDEV